MTIHFNYWLTGTGWAEVFFTSDKQNLRFTFSYLSDPLADLLSGLCRLIIRQSDNETIIFEEEPGQHSLIITKLDKENIKLEIFGDVELEGISEPNKGQAKKQLLYSDLDTLNNFASIICIGVHSLLERHTLAEYKEEWCLFEFPIDHYKYLQKLLQR